MTQETNPSGISARHATPAMSRPWLISMALMAALLTVPITAAAQDATAQDATAQSAPTFSLAPHVGVIAPQPFVDLGSFPIFGLEAGFIMPFDAGSMVRPLSLNFDVMFTAPRAEGEGVSADLGAEGADYQWELVERMLILELSAIWRFTPAGKGLSAFAQVGPRFYMMESVMNAEGNNGQTFGENSEVGREFGFVVGGGAEYALGPGAIFGALEFSFSDLKQEITGDANNGALVLDLGYRLFF